MTDELVHFRSAINPAEAHLWRGLLEEAGIKAQVVGDYLNAGVGDIPGVQAEVWVPGSQVTEAEEVLAEHASQPVGEEEEED